ncbi:uncharacterized protein LOC116343219 [Contarinia nasturtii]|uniref:uncharacterized protein LOC116343219 n=1 Tax=Contarinia nasturtii TaxID=265458 RepID=UPI0012D38174|nr:uncharacterized protein LOC116343219 [Contarinia nasturtii]
MLDLIRNEQYELNSTNKRLTQEANELRKQVTLFENKNQENNTQTKGNLMLINSPNANATTHTQNQLDSKLTMRRVASIDTPIKSRDENATETDNEGEEVIKCRCHLGTEPISNVKQTTQPFNDRDGLPKKSVVVTKTIQPMQNTECVSTQHKFPINSCGTRDVSPVKRKMSQLILQ